MKAKQVHDMTDQELEAKLLSLRKELFKLRFSHATGQLANPIMIKSCKRDIARVITIQKEREIKKARAERV